MATKGGRIDFMFLGPPYLAAGSATGNGVLTLTKNLQIGRTKILFAFNYSQGWQTMGVM